MPGMPMPVTAALPRRSTGLKRLCSGLSFLRACLSLDPVCGGAVDGACEPVCEGAVGGARERRCGGIECRGVQQEMWW
ncbi:hypothetical protein B0H16DRAFT_1611629 [Mycena metata]|uniref:Uncharacterized protein n=1 Tax=Mycena metata TaxID=1033252 RepID=A0AAD7MH51_9AGAR|nr:hypothetical protein B0H16DRAFT_1611629 [Mycena metata]